MRRFRFSLETLLSVRHHRQRACEMKVAEIERQRREVAEERERIGGELSSTYQRERSASSAGMVNIDALRALSQYVRLLCARRRAADLHLGKIEKKKDAALAELVEANRDVKLLENVREHRLGEWKKENEREDQAFMDELGVGGFRRQRGGMLRVLFFLILALALAGGGVFAYKKGYLGRNYWRNVSAASVETPAPGAAAAGAGASQPAGAVASATPETSEMPPDVMFDATQEVYYFSNELGKNLRISTVLKQLGEERARLSEKEEALSRREEDLLRRENELVVREDEVEKKWQEALRALEANQKILVAQESKEAKERQGMIGRLAQSIAGARPASGAELLRRVDSSILPEVVKQIPDEELSKILEKMASSAAEDDEIKTQLELILKIMGKVQDATGPAQAGGSKTSS